MAKGWGKQLGGSTGKNSGMAGGPGHRFRGMGAPVDKAKNIKGTLGRIAAYLAREKIVLALVFALVAVSALLNLAGPYLIGVAIDRYIIPGDLPGLLSISLVMISVYAGSALAVWLQDYLMIGTAQKTVLRMRKDLFGKLHSLPLRFFDERTHGEVMSRFTNDMDNISHSLSNSTTQVFAGLITVTGTLAMMLWLSPVLTIISLVMIPLMTFSTKLIAKKTRSHFAEQQKNLGELNGLIEETISAQREVKVFCRENKVIREFGEVNLKLKQSGTRAQIFSGLIPPMMIVFANLNFAALATAGGWLAVKGALTIGVIVSFINYSRQLNRPLTDLANQYNMIQAAIAGAERVFEVIDEEPEAETEAEEGESTLVPANIKGEVSFNNVSFAYVKDIPVLQNINLQAFPGQTIALVGPTGAGKTTIINLLTRFYDVDQGSITIDGQDIRTIRRKSLRSLLGVVLQDTYLFSESVRENIRYGRLEAAAAEVEAAAKLANAHQFIQRLPQGYDTVLAEDGGSLSHGQRQLLAIARAVLADPAILILDEATSSVDTRTEMQIQQALLSLMHRRTSFVIAHRLGTIRQADKILVIDGGRIVEQGSHEELLAAKGFYHNLYVNQLNRQACR
jgi:ATP-binding cassette subfamily B protein